MRGSASSLTLETVREHLGDRAARKLSRALRSSLDSETVERARRFLSDVPGDRITRLKDRAAFAAAMTHLVRTDIGVRRWAMQSLSVKRKAPRKPRPQRARSHRSKSKKAA